MNGRRRLRTRIGDAWLGMDDLGRAAAVSSALLVVFLMIVLVALLGR